MTPALFLDVFLVFVSVVWIRRAFWVSRMGTKNPPIEKIARPASSAPKVTVIVPARNEEKNIANCLFHLFKQNYRNYEIIVVDDRSTDKTPHLLENFKKLSPVPFRVVRIEKLPEGWTGKNHGMWCASKAAAGEWMLFTDADTTHSPESLSSAMAAAESRKIDFLTLAPETESRSFWEKTVQPLAVGSLALWFDSEKVNDPKSGVVLANGQFILVKKEVYEKVGGNESVKKEVVEDVELAKKVRAAGYTMQFLNGTNLYATRMYSTLREIKTGWTRIFTYLFDKNAAAILEKIAMFVFFSIAPFAICLYEVVVALAAPALFDAAAFGLSSALSATIVVFRWKGNRLLKTDPRYALLHPLGSVVMVWILAVCVVRIWTNRPSAWRGDLHR